MRLLACKDETSGWVRIVLSHPCGRRQIRRKDGAPSSHCRRETFVLHVEIEAKRKMGRIAERDRVKTILQVAVALSVLLAAAGMQPQSATPWVIGPFTRPAWGIR